MEWADGSCGKDMILPLERRGLKVICAPIPLPSLCDDIAALTRALERTSGPVVLAGHAYSGAVIEAIREERVESAVYIAALAPDEGETVAQVFYRDESHPESRNWLRTNMALSGCRKTDLAVQLRTKLRSIKRTLWLQCSGRFSSPAFKSLADGNLMNSRTVAIRSRRFAERAARTSRRGQRSAVKRRRCCSKTFLIGY